MTISYFYHEVKRGGGGLRLNVIMTLYFGSVPLQWSDYRSGSALSPVYTRPLTRIRIRIKLIRVRVNALIRIAIRVT